MSEDILILIPTKPEYIPSIDDQQKAKHTLELFLPKADCIRINVTGEIRFIDAGGNLEKIFCAICSKEIDMSWWVQMMDISYEKTKFADLSVTTPCCSTICSLNDLQYIQSAGFARFSIEVLNPSNDIDIYSVLSLEAILKCKLRKIWAHY